MNKIIAWIIAIGIPLFTFFFVGYKLSGNDLEVVFIGLGIGLLVVFILVVWAWSIIYLTEDN